LFDSSIYLHAFLFSFQDKFGNPVDLTAPSKSSSLAAAAGKESDAGIKLRQAALERIAQADGKKTEAETKALEAEEAAKKKREEEEAAKKKAEEEEAAAKKKAEEEEAARKKAEEEEATRLKAEEEAAKKKAEAEAAARKKTEEEEERKAEPWKPRSSLADLLAKQKAPTQEPPAPRIVPGPPPGFFKAAPSTSPKSVRHVYTKQELLR
jgi:hypothetical protein